MSMNPTAPFLFVIDTEDYAGNFERPLCAYLTGRIGECEVGHKEAAAFMEETGLEPFENVTEEPDDHGCHRPVTIYPTPGWFNHGNGGHFRDGDEVAALADYRETVRKEGYNSLWHGYLKGWREDPADRSRYTDAGWTEEKLAEAAAEKEREAEERIACTEVSKWPAYLSVAILFETEPTADQIALMKKRAVQFAALPARRYGNEPVSSRISKITGFRLIKQTITRTLDSRAV